MLGSPLFAPCPARVSVGEDAGRPVVEAWILIGALPIAGPAVATARVEKAWFRGEPDLTQKRRSQLLALDLRSRSSRWVQRCRCPCALCSCWSHNTAQTGRRDPLEPNPGRTVHRLPEWKESPGSRRLRRNHHSAPRAEEWGSPCRRSNSSNSHTDEE